MTSNNEKSFKVGDKVKIIKNCGYIGVYEVNGGKGMVGEVIGVQNFMGVPYKVRSSMFIAKRAFDYSEHWWFNADDLELVDNSSETNFWDFRDKVEVVAEKKCPRCGNKLVEKQSESYGTILKCPDCGYC